MKNFRQIAEANPNMTKVMVYKHCPEIIVRSKDGSTNRYNFKYQETANEVANLLRMVII